MSPYLRLIDPDGFRHLAFMNATGAGVLIRDLLRKKAPLGRRSCHQVGPCQNKLPTNPGLRRTHGVGAAWAGHGRWTLPRATALPASSFPSRQASLSRAATTRYDGHLVFAWEACAEPPLARTGPCGCQEGTGGPDTAQAAEGKGALLLTWKELHDDSLHARTPLGPPAQCCHRSE